jgi:hypothetical protein
MISRKKRCAKEGCPLFFILWIHGPTKTVFTPLDTSGVLVLGVIASYGFLLVHLPERIETRVIISEGGALVAEGHYDQAIERYKGLEKLGQKQKMQAKIDIAQQEKRAAQQLELAQQKFAAGDQKTAREIIKNIPPGTRAAVKARALRSKLGL